MAVKLAMPRFKNLIEDDDLVYHDYGKDRYEECRCGAGEDSCVCYPQFETLNEAIEGIVDSQFEGDTLWFSQTKKPVIVSEPKKLDLKPLYVALSCGYHKTTQALGVFKTMREAVVEIIDTITKEELDEIKSEIDITETEEVIKYFVNEEDDFCAFELDFSIEEGFEFFDFTRWSDWNSQNLDDLMEALKDNKSTKLEIKK